MADEAGDAGEMDDVGADVDVQGEGLGEGHFLSFLWLPLFAFLSLLSSLFAPF